MFLVIPGVCHLVIAKGHVAHRQVKGIVRKTHPLKAVHRDVGLGIKLSGDPSGDRIQFHAVECGILHGIRQHTQEIPRAHGRLQQIFGIQSHLLHSLVNPLNNGRGGVVGV